MIKIGEEMGRFNMDSTIVVLFGKDRLRWIESLQAEQTVKLGQLIGRRVWSNSQ